MKQIIHRGLIPVFLVGICILQLTASAQLPVSAIRGTITDSTGAPIARATVTVKEKGTGLVRTTFSQAQGEYQIEDLAPGDYEITIVAPSFATIMQMQTLQVGDDRTLNVALQPGQVQHLINVTGAITGLNFTDSQI